MSGIKEWQHLKIPFKDIEIATNNFEACIGRGEYGMVYKGELSISGKLTKIAVRRLNENYGQGLKEFLTEIQLLSGQKHPNLISFIGYCDEGREKMIVYEYAERGSLDQYIRRSNTTATLTWLQRLKICVDAARGLDHLHNHAGQHQTIIHRDMKSSNILLDDEWVAKVSGFGLSKLSFSGLNRSAIITNAFGTPGYCEPEYIITGIVTKKSDVYSFGMVLFEVLFGRLCSVKYEDGFLLSANLAKDYYKNKRLDEMIDPSLKEQLIPYTMDKFSSIAYECLQDDQRQRPSMDVVRKELEETLNIHSMAHKRKKFKLEDIKTATGNFAETCLIGSGGYGKVYKAEIDHFDRITLFQNEGIKRTGEASNKRNIVAVKCILNDTEGQGKQGFSVEIEMLIRCEHPNIVSLLGFCDELNELILVYEHAPNGSLDDYLQNIDKKPHLTWAQRIRIGLNIAHGLNYLHSNLWGKETMIHRDIKSANILLAENLDAKIADFGLSKIGPANQQVNTLLTKRVVGTEFYVDPEYEKTGKLKKESDVYSFGVVLFEILTGRLAFDQTYKMENEKGLAPIARRHFSEGTIMDIVDPKIMQEAEKFLFNLKIGPNQDSIKAFSKIAYRCLSETQSKRPTMEVVIKELQNALNIQENRTDIFRFSLKDVKLSTKNFSDNNCIIEGAFGKIYKGEVEYDNIPKTIVAKRLSQYVQEHLFFKDLEILFGHKHENVIHPLGYCKEMDEKIIVYENASNGSLSRYLNDASLLTWTKRLKICVDIANGLNFLHRGDANKQVIIHRDIKSDNILLNGDWKAKICGFEISLIIPTNHDICDIVGSPGYCDPMYWETGLLTKESDIYSFGVVLFEILCGRLACPKNIRDSSQFLDSLVKSHCRVGRLEEIVFDGIKEQIVLKSLTIFRRIANQCLHEEREKRPTADEVVIQLKKALEFQIKGEILSARKFSYRNRCPHRWLSLPESRFPKVVKMLDISNLMIKIKAKTQVLSPKIYGVHLVFKFCDSRNVSCKPIFVNLKYTKGSETFHAYFATRRDNNWMMIELYRFLNQKEDTVFKFFLESLSPYHRGDDMIYIEGVEFRAIDNVEHEEIEKSNPKVGKIQQLPSKSDEIFEWSKNFDDGAKMYSLSELNGKKHLMLSAKAAFSNFSDLKLLSSKPLAESRFREVIELQSQQICRITCTIKSQMLSQNTEYLCYLVFKLSDNSQGLYSPVEVQDLLHQEKKEAEYIYFISPSEWNIHDTTWVPEQRDDGWMEVNVWKLNSGELKNDHLPVSLKLINLEGIMSGLIVCGLEFRPM